MSTDSRKGQSVLLAGCGDIGTGLGQLLLAAGTQVTGLRRDPARLPAGFEGLAGDFADPQSLAGLTDRHFDQVVVTLTPTAYNEAAYEAAYVRGLENLLGALHPAPGHLIYVSSTSVYGQGDHQWVDESSPTEPTQFAGRCQLAAEKLLAASGIPQTVVRAAGIYGPGRTRLVDQVRQGTICGPEDRLYTNRIHRDDLVGFLAHLVGLRASGEALHDTYLAVDSHSATLWDVQSWLARQLGHDPFAMATTPVPDRSSKRCRNTRLRESGYTLRYPDFMRGYQALLAQ